MNHTEQGRFVNKASDQRFVPLRYMRKATKIIVGALKNGRPVEWIEIERLESIRGTESGVPASFVLEAAVRRKITLPARQGQVTARQSGVSDDVRQVSVFQDH